MWEKSRSEYMMIKVDECNYHKINEYFLRVAYEIKFLHIEAVDWWYLKHMCQYVDIIRQYANITPLQCMMKCRILRCLFINICRYSRNWINLVNKCNLSLCFSEYYNIIKAFKSQDSILIETRKFNFMSGKFSRMSFRIWK